MRALLNLFVSLHEKRFYFSNGRVMSEYPMIKHVEKTSTKENFFAK